MNFLVNPNEIGLTVNLGVKHFERETALLIFYEILLTGSWTTFMKISLKNCMDIKGLT